MLLANDAPGNLDERRVSGLFNGTKLMSLFTFKTTEYAGISKTDRATYLPTQGTALSPFFFSRSSQSECSDAAMPGSGTHLRSGDGGRGRYS